MKKSGFRELALVLPLLCAVIVIPLSARTFKTLVRFDGTDGAGPWSLVQGNDGNFYATTWGNSGGEVFKMTPAGKLTILYHFCSEMNCADGADPYAGLVQAANGNFYGTTGGGGTRNLGTVFEITPNGKLTTLYSFGTQTNDGEWPYGVLVQGTNRDFYGTTFAGGAYGGGTVFRISPTGKLTTLHSFCQASQSCPDGKQPMAGLVRGADGNYYGTTSSGGTAAYCGGIQCGTVFKITPAGRFTTLHSFCSQMGCSDGSHPVGALVLGTDRSFYGTTAGSHGAPDSVFKISLRGSLTTLYTFCQQKNCSDGSAPYAGLALGADADFYGTTSAGGADGGYGTVFKITRKGQLTTLHTFCEDGFYPCSDGYSPAAALVQASDGTFYGSTAAGGVKCDDGNTCGTVFKVGP